MNKHQNRLEYLCHRFGLNRLCKRRKVNSKYMSQYINHGIEPPNTTEGRRVKEAMWIISKRTIRRRKNRAERKKLYTDKGWKNQRDFEDNGVIPKNPLN